MDGNRDKTHCCRSCAPRRPKLLGVVWMACMVMSFFGPSNFESPIFDSTNRDSTNLDRSNAFLGGCSWVFWGPGIAQAQQLKPIRWGDRQPQHEDADHRNESKDVGVVQHGEAIPTDDLGRPLIWRPTAQVIDATGDAQTSATGHPSDAAPTGGETRARNQTGAGASSPANFGSPAGGNAKPTHTSVPTRLRATSVEDALKRRGTITFRKTPLQEVVFLLSDLWQINIVAGETVTGDVSGTFHETPLREVLSAILSASGYGYRQTGNSLIVLPIDQIGSDNPDFVSRTLRLPPDGEPDSLLDAARLLLSERGQILHVGGDRVLVKDDAVRIEKVQSLFVDLGAPRETPATASKLGSDAENTDAADSGSVNADSTEADATKLTRRIDDALYQDAIPTVSGEGIAYFTLQYTEAEQMQVSLETIMGDSVTVAVFSEENRIMIRGETSDLQLAREAIKQLDQPRPQVRITAVIYDVSLEEIERLGINWNVNPHSAAITGLLNSETQVFRNAAAATTNFITDTTATGGFNLDIRTINNRADIGALLQALDNSSESKLLADPSITVGDRRQASIDIVTRVPVIALQPAEDSAAVISQVEFVDAGVKLEVTPRIGRDGTIEMQVQPTYSVVVDYVANNPVIDERKANTTVRVADGQMFVLGGLRQKNVNETVRGVPFLKDIKYVGRLFQSHDTEVRESELIVFLKPELITPYYGGTLREQRAACVGVQQLDAIPYASRRPQVCCCKDPYCPNHHPRYRINGGTSDLEMLGGWGIGGQVVAGPNAHEVIRSDEIASPAVVPMDEPVVPPATVGTPMDFGLSAPDDASTPVTSPTSDSPSHDDAYRFAPVAVEVQLP